MNPALESMPSAPTYIVPQPSEEPTLASAYALLTDCLERLKQACHATPDARACADLAFALEHAATDAITCLMSQAEKVS